MQRGPQPCNETASTGLTWIHRCSNISSLHVHAVTSSRFRKRNWRRGRNNGSHVDWQRPRLPRSSRLLLPTVTDCNLYVLHVEHVEANQPSKATSAAQSPRSRTSKLDAVSSARHVVDETSKSHVACCEECRTPPSISDHAHRCELHAEFDWRPPAHCHGMTRPAAECKTKLLHSSGR